MQVRKELLSEIQAIIAASREIAIRSVDFERVLMYWHIGRKILEEEQEGKERAEYGKYLLKTLSEQLQPLYGSGFSVRQLERYRQFYRTFPIASALRSQFSWTHYKLLISIDNEDKREFYISESAKNNWTARQLERQINSQLFERLLLSNDVQSVLAVASAEKMPADTKDIIKDSFALPKPMLAWWSCLQITFKNNFPSRAVFHARDTAGTYQHLNLYEPATPLPDYLMVPRGQVWGWPIWQ